MAKSKKKTSQTAGIRAALDTRPTRIFDAIRDTLDFRDLMYVPTLVEVPVTMPLSAYRDIGVPVLNQGQEGACTGFGLATVANFLLRTRRDQPDVVDVSPRMLYEMAKRYDEWPGENYSGSSARGAVKGWHKHGVCAEGDWPYTIENASNDNWLTPQRAQCASDRPLGAYFRVNHKDLVAMHSAIAETRILFATATVHQGWYEVGGDGVVPFKPGRVGGHAFAIVAYDRHGLWVQNSWGPEWGFHGFCRVSYDDWLVNGTDVWVARLGAPVLLNTPQAQAVTRSAGAGASVTYSNADLRPHIVSLGNDGALRPGGVFGTTANEVRQIFKPGGDFDAITADWPTKRLLLYAHGGLVGEDAAIQRVADLRIPFLDCEIYPVSFIWKTDFWTTITNILSDAIRRRKPEGFLDAAKDFMLDRLDDAIEPIARLVGGRLLWDEMKENALSATESKQGGARFVLDQVAELAARTPKLEIHIVGHSAGSILFAPLISRLTGPKPKGLAQVVRSCTLWAPAVTMDRFAADYIPAIKSGAIERFALFTLADQTEEDDHCANIYHKSLLYLVSNAFEAKQRIPLFRDGIPILGMEKFVTEDKELKGLIDKGKIDWVLSPNDISTGSPKASRAVHHGDFDDDEATLRATIARICGTKKNSATCVRFGASATRSMDVRRQIAARMPQASTETA